jgi:hypothetical protein
MDEEEVWIACDELDTTATVDGAAGFGDDELLAGTTRADVGTGEVEEGGRDPDFFTV